ncbi:MAG TPA: malto-oligosyltrehalose synthase [Longimicrobium sp.]|nr:malto-oligosyltrehalose synthase [Longimicrobium sp.]
MNPSETPSGGGSGSFRVPSSTYRIQFNAGFTFRDAASIVPYLAELGVSDLYASPYLQARPGSLHGYDIVDHGTLNREIGSEHDHARLAAALREQGMGHLLDIVPNHMGIAGGANQWWNDVLENGPTSAHAPFFDIDWTPRKVELDGKVLLPVLGGQYGRVLEAGELKLVFEKGRFRIQYWETPFPAAPSSTGAVLRLALERLDGVLDTEHPDRMELESIATALERLPARRHIDPVSVSERRREKVVTQRRLSALYDASADVRGALDAAVEEFNGTPGNPHSFDRLDALLNEQAYRLAFWRVAAEEINYRRFFDVNDLAGVRVEVPRVFQETHRLILRLVREGRVTGLRIDHPDGLFHPHDYLRTLQRECGGAEPGQHVYLLVEKILTGDEPLPREWPVAGTVGYEFLNRVNGLFVAQANEEAMDTAYRVFTGSRARFPDLVYEKKRLILRVALVSELTVLTSMLSRISEQNRCSRDFTWGALRDALRETVACFPVYRTYVDAYAGVVTERDAGYVDQAVRRAKRRNPGTSGLIFDFIRDTLLLKWPDGLAPEGREEHARFVMKFQQLTGPVMAKGVEDTSFYVFNRLVSLNEVGGEPDRFGISPEEFHAFNLERAEQWPHAMSASSTHDTKRSEDVRARINVLSEIPDLWSERVNAWAGLNAGLLRDEDGQRIPDANDEYLLYQTLVGAWPFGTLDDQAHQDFVARVQQYMEKATREAKTHTSWINPDPAYDEGLEDFIAAILRRGENGFVDDLLPFQRTIARLGMLNSLAQTLVKHTSPGVPDVYQGQETWDFSLVDPDNRRPVDFALRRALLESLRERAEQVDRGQLCRELVEGWEDGRIKLHVVQTALRLRQALPAVFSAGEYVPLVAEGDCAEHVLAFARTGGGAAVITVVPRLVATLTRDRGFALPDARTWKGTRIPLPAHLAGAYRNALTGDEVRAGEDGIAAGEVLGAFPVALLERM